MKYSRPEAFRRIREFVLSNMRDDETSCQAAARLGLFCRGYDQWTTEQLRGIYPWLAVRLPKDATREQLLKLIVAWDGARMLVHDVPTTCEAKALDHEGCLGLERHKGDSLKKLFPQLFKPEDEIVDVTES